MSEQSRMAAKIRAKQGQSQPVEIGEHQYVYKLLKRKKCQKVLYNLVTPFIKIVSTVIETVHVPIGDLITALIKGEEDFDFEAYFKEMFKDKSSFNMDSIAKLFETLPFEKYWELACSILDDVEIDGTQYGKLDNHDFFDTRPLDLVKAISQGITVNYPFLIGFVKKKGDGSDDSSPATPRPSVK